MLAGDPLLWHEICRRPYLNARNAKDAKRHGDDARGDGRRPPITDKTAEK